MYEAEVSPALISNVTDALIEQVKAWLSRPLDALYPVVYLDVLKVKIREQGRVESRAVYTATGITLGGKMEVLGLWTSAMEGAEFWLQVLTELQNRGVKDIFIVCVDDLKGFPAGHREGVSEDQRAAMHRAHGASQPELRKLEGAQAGGPGLEVDLSCCEPGRSRAAAG